MDELKTVKRSQIYVGERQREDYGDLDELAADLFSPTGQIQTLAVCERDDKEQPYELLAGGRRYYAGEIVEQKNGIPEGCFPFHIRIYPKDLDEVAKKEIELTENLLRKQLTWSEEARAVAEIHSLQELKTTGPAHKHNLDGHSMRNTAAKIGRSHQYVNDNLQLAKAIASIPELATAKTASEAKAIVNRVKEQAAVSELAKRAESKQAQTPLDQLRKQLMSQYHHQDVFEYLDTLPDKSFDLIEIDPPYDCWFEKRGALSSKGSKAAESFRKKDFVQVDDFESFFNKVLEKVDRLARDNSWLICWYAQEPYANIVFEALKAHGWNGMRIPAIWFKDVAARASTAPDYYLGRTYETFYYMFRGKVALNKRATSDIFPHKVEHHSKRIHGTEKPLPLMKDIYQTFLPPSSQILIPFLGSGNGIIAAAESKMRAEGAELAESFREAFIARIAEWGE